MAYIADDVYQGALAVLSQATRLVITASEARDANSLSPLGDALVRFAQHDDKRTLTVLSIKNGTVTRSGAASHFALLGGGKVLASGPLSNVQRVTQGQDFELSEIDIAF